MKKYLLIIIIMQIFASILFSQESSNKALNDAVYYMLMSVPKFTAPPAEYNAQTIRMHFKIDNGNYEISIY